VHMLKIFELKLRHQMLLLRGQIMLNY
jgi:hypothetical protein